MRSRNILTLLIFVLVFTVYLLTMCPTVYVGDSGELISAAWTLGIPHPPGYPLFCLLGRAFTYIPLSTIAFRVNLVAVVFGSLTILILFLLLNKLVSLDWRISSIKVDSLLSAFFTSLSFAFTRTFWSQSLMAKGALYVINIFFLIVIIYFLLLWYFERKDKYLYLGSFFYGLCLTNHHTALGFAPAILTFVFIVDRSVFKRGGLILKLLFMFVLGLLIYLYLPIRAAVYPPINSGNPADLRGMLEHVLRKQYGGLVKNPYSMELFFNHMKYGLMMVIEQFPVWLIFIPVIGLIGLFKKFRELFILTVVLFFSIGGGIILGLNFDMTQATLEVNKLFYLPLYLMIAIWLFFGILVLKELIKGRFFGYLIVLFLIFGTVLFIVINYAVNDKSKNYLAYDYGVNTLKVCDKDAVIFSLEDTPLYQLAYLKFVEEARADVTVCDENGTAFRTILTRDDKGIVYKNFLQKRVSEYFLQVVNLGKPVYHTMESSLSINPSIKTVPTGILYKLINGKENDNVSEIFWRSFKIPESSYEYDVFNRDMIARYHLFLGEYYYKLGKKELALNEYRMSGDIAYDMDWVHHEIGMVYGRHGLKEEYLREMETAAKLYRFSVERRNNLGNAYLSFGRTKEAIEEFEMAVKLSPEMSVPHHNLALAYAAISRKEDAKRQYEIAVSLGQRESINALVQLYIEEGNNYFKDGKPDEAILSYSRILKIAPDFPDAYYNIGVMYYRKNMLQEAVSFWNKTLELAPDHKGAKNGLSLINR